MRTKTFLEEKKHKNGKKKVASLKNEKGESVKDARRFLRNVRDQCFKNDCKLYTQHRLPKKNKTKTYL